MELTNFDGVASVFMLDLRLGVCFNSEETM